MKLEQLTDVVEWVEKVDSFLWLDMEADALTMAKQARELDKKLYYWDLSDLNYSRIEKKIEQLEDELIERVTLAVSSFIDIDDNYVIEEIPYIREWLLDDLELEEESGNIYKINREKIA